MSTSLPFFKFFTSGWENGDISYESMTNQGVFISVCSFYWARNCSVSEQKLLKKFRKHAKNIQTLTKSGLILVENCEIFIPFLDEQYSKKSNSKVKNHQNGLLGGRPKNNPNITHIEKRRLEEDQYEDKIEDNIREEAFDSEKTFFPDSSNPTQSDFVLPSHIDEEVWKEYIKVREHKKPKISDRLKEFILTDLAKFPKDDATEILKQTMINGWSGFYAIKEKPFCFETAKTLAHVQIGEYKLDEATKKVYAMDGNIHRNWEWDHELHGMVPIL